MFLVNSVFPYPAHLANKETFANFLAIEKILMAIKLVASELSGIKKNNFFRMFRNKKKLNIF